MSTSPSLPHRWNLIGTNFGSPSTPQRVPGTGLPGGPNASYTIVDTLTSITYGPTGTEYTVGPTAFTHVDDTRITVNIGPASGSNAYFRLTVGGQVTTSVTPSFSFAAPVIVSVTPNYGPTSNPAANGSSVTLAVIAPLLDPLSTLSVQIGSGNKWTPVTPIVPQTPSDIARATNGDGSVNIQMPLPISWAGQGLGIQLIPGTTSPAGATSSALTINSTFSYNAPVITAAYVLPAVFSPPGTTGIAGVGGRNFLDPVCPWTNSPNPLWACDTSLGQLYQIVM